jgi:hypothetical protein
VGGKVRIAYVTSRYIEAEKFMRISEYFTGVESKSGRIIERTDPTQRTGYYFIVDLSWHPGVVLPKGTKVELDYVRNDIAAPQHAEFTFPAAAGTWPEIFLGLTGAAWPRDDLSIVAYQITLEDPDGTTLAEQESFLWGLPPLKTEPDDKVAAATGAPTASSATTAAPATSTASPTPAGAAVPAASDAGGATAKP